MVELTTLADGAEALVLDWAPADTWALADVWGTEICGSATLVSVSALTAAVPEAAMEKVVAKIPAGRLGEPDEVARVVEGHYRALGIPVDVYDLTDLPPELFLPASYARKPDAFVAVQRRVLDAAGQPWALVPEADVRGRAWAQHRPIRARRLLP